MKQGKMQIQKSLLLLWISIVFILLHSFYLKMHKIVVTSFTLTSSIEKKGPFLELYFGLNFL